MYSPETIRKMLDTAEQYRRKYEAMDPKDIPMCISKGNTKIGHALNVSIMPILTCPNCKQCAPYCYDVKSCVRFSDTVISARMRNTVLLWKDRDEFFRRIDDACSRRRKNKFFRWHVAGDIIDMDYFSRMCEIARRHPDFKFWTYTKNYKVVNNYKGTIPSNFVIMFSEWRGLEMENPQGRPEFRVVFHDDPVKPVGFYCPGNCDVCKRLNRGCIAGETTYCNEH